MWGSQLSLSTCRPDASDIRLSLSNLMVLRIIKILKGEKHWHKNISNSNLNIFDKDIKLSSAVIGKYKKFPLDQSDLTWWAHSIVQTLTIFFCQANKHIRIRHLTTFNHLTTILNWLNKTKYFRLRLSDEVSERSL